VRLKSVFLGIAASGAIVLSTVAATLPASAAPATSSQVSISAPHSGLVPHSPQGKLLCTSNGVFCVQRITSVLNGTAYISGWADTVSWRGWFELKGPDGHIANFPSNGTTFWEAGVNSWQKAVPVQSYTLIAWQDPPPATPREIASLSFAVNNN
jgi:hypothetical protein